MSKFLRKHQTALIALAVYNFVVFFPVAFLGRVVSPNDVFHNFQPWAATRAETVHPQNALLNDPPTAYYTIFSLVKDDWRTFHWNPYLAAGVPGFGSSASAVLAPFVLVPLLVAPLEWSFTLLMFLKINTAFVFAYLWLREERLGRRGAAVGAVVVAGAGVYAVRLLWQITNVTPLFPALLWVLRRTMRGKPPSTAVVTLIALAYALAGFPAAMAYGVYVVAGYFVFLWSAGVLAGWRAGVPRLRLGTRRRDAAGPAGGTPAFLRVALGVAIALMIAAPSLVPFAQFIQRSGYLEIRKTNSLAGVYPLEHWRNLIEPERLGNPAYKNWLGDPRLGVLNNYVETTIYLGMIVLALAVIGLLNRHARARWFWLAAAVVILACMFGAPAIAPMVAKLPGFKYSALARAGLLLPLPIGYLAAAGAARLAFWIRRYATLRNVAAGALAAFIAFDLGLVAGRFHPYLEPKDARVPSTPMIDFLRAEEGPFRVAPFFDYFWPNSAELFRIEDVRSHFSSEGDYRKLLQRLDPGVWSGQSTVLQFNSLKYNFSDPLSGVLGIRYYIEHTNMDIIKWTTFAGTSPAVQETGIIRYGPGALLQRTIRIDEEPFYAIEVPAHIDAGHGLNATLFKDGRAVWSRLFTKADADVMHKLYIPLSPYARRGETVTLRLRSIGARGYVPEGANTVAGETKLYYARVKVPVVFERELPDGRLFRNLTELPRFWPAGNARVTLVKYEPHEQRVVTESTEAFFLNSSEKLTPELAVTIDGKRVQPSRINLVFAGLQVPAGRHEIVFSRRLARGWWWVAGLGIVLLLISSLPRRSPGTRRATATGA